MAEGGDRDGGVVSVVIVGWCQRASVMMVNDVLEVKS